MEMKMLEEWLKSEQIEKEQQSTEHTKVVLKKVKEVCIKCM